jgi:hypothetical protein
MGSKVRTYVIANPDSPRESENVRQYGNGVVRTVTHDGTTNIVVWDFTNDKHR